MDVERHTLLIRRLLYVIGWKRFLHIIVEQLEMME
jgi:hypothetical protein